MIKRIGFIFFHIGCYISFFLIWNLLVRFPEEITTKLIFVLACPFVISVLIYMIYIKEKQVLEHNLWRKMSREGKII